MSRLKYSLQENLLTLLCFSDSASKIIRNLVPPSKFDGDFRIIANAAVDYIDAYKKPPGAHIADLLDNELSGSSGQGDALKSILAAIYNTRKDINEPFVMNRLSVFLNIQNMREGIIEAAQLLQDETEGSLEQAEEIFARLRRKQVTTFDPGTRLGTKESLQFYTEPTDTFLTGIPALDQRRLGPTRQEFLLFMGLMGRGKTWWLIHLGKQCIQQRAKVLHITLEVRKPIVFQRYYQSIFALTKRETASLVATWKTDELGRIHSLGSEEYKARGSLDQPETMKYLEQQIKRWGPRLQNYLIVKEFPTRKLTFQGLVAYLDMLYDETGFTPDVLLLDYADLMTLDTSNFRIELGNLCMDLRGLAVERNFGLATVSQSNREGVGKKKLSEAHVGEDFSKLQTADVAFAYSQTAQELKRGLARLSVLKARNEDGNFDLLMAQNYTAGQFCLKSHVLSGKKYWEEVEQDPSGGGESNK